MARTLIHVGMLALGLCAARASAALVILGWSANSETNVAGYRVHVGPESRGYDTVHDVGNVTHFARDYALGLHFLTVTAYDTEGLESEFGEEWVLLIVEPPTIRFESNRLAWIGSGTFQLRWMTSATTNEQIVFTNHVPLGLFPENSMVSVRRFDLGATNVISSFSAPLFYNPPRVVSAMQLRVVLQRTHELGKPFADFTEASFFDAATNQAFYRARLEILRSGPRLH